MSWIQPYHLSHTTQWRFCWFALTYFTKNAITPFFIGGSQQMRHLFLENYIDYLNLHSYKLSLYLSSCQRSLIVMYGNELSQVLHGSYNLVSRMYHIHVSYPANKYPKFSIRGTLPIEARPYFIFNVIRSSNRSTPFLVGWQGS